MQNNSALKFITPLLLVLLSATMTARACPGSPATEPLLQSLKHDVTQLTTDAMAGRRTGREGARLTADYLTQRYKQLGLTPWQQQLRHPFDYGADWSKRRGVNLIAWVPGPPPYRLVMAHYDHLGRVKGKVHPGADDNASGVAVMLALAERAQRTRKSRGLIFAALDAEENGLHGSEALAKQFEQEPLEWVLNLDMVGRPDRAGKGRLWWQHGWDYGRVALTGLKQHLCIRKGSRRMKGYDGERYDSLKASDHYPFHQAGVPWFYIGVTAHKDYHSPADNAERLDYDFMASVVDGAWWLLNQPPSGNHKQ